MSQTPTPITDPGAFRSLLAQLHGEPLVAMDTEAASFHRHRDRVYLLQLSTQRETWLVDPLALPGLPGFGDLLASTAVQCLFHDADYDLRLLGKEFGFRASRLFDTRVAAQFLNEPGIGLAALLEKYFGVKPDKRFQRADWSTRPLTPGMLEYAAMDTRHLPDLAELLRTRLIEMGRLTWVEEECELLTRVRWADPEPPEVEAMEVKGARALSPRGLAIFRELYVWRAQVADALDRAAFRILGNEAMFALASEPPADVPALRGVRGVGREVAERRGSEILTAIRRGLSLAEADLPRFPRPPRHRPDPAVITRLERLKSLRERLVARLGLAPGVLCPNWLLEGIARAAPTTPESLEAVEGARRWQVKEFGADLLEAVQG